MTEDDAKKKPQKQPDPTPPIPFDDDDPMYTRVTLLKKTKNPSDEYAWADFASYYRKYIYNVVRRMGLSHHDADEVVQMTLVKVWNAMPEFKYEPKRGRFRGWLCTVAGNAARNYLRSRGPEGIPLSAFGRDEPDTPELTVRPEIEQFAKEEWERYLPELALKNIAGHFERRTIQAFQMLSQGVPPADVAKRLGLSENSVYVYKKRVLEKLAEEVERLQAEL